MRVRVSKTHLAMQKDGRLAERVTILSEFDAPSDQYITVYEAGKPILVIEPD